MPFWGVISAGPVKLSLRYKAAYWYACATKRVA